MTNLQRKRASGCDDGLQVNIIISSSSGSEMFLRTGVLKICSKFTGEHSCQSVILIKLQSNFIEIILLH